ELWLAEGVEPAVREDVRGMRRRAVELQLPWGDELTEECLVTDVQERLGDIRVPTLVVVGAEDVEDVRRYALVLESSIADAEYAVIEGAAHVPSLERPGAFDAAVLPFLERSSAS